MRFVDNLFNSKSRTQILRFFFRNEGAFSIRDVASHLRLRDKEVEREIQALILLGIIKKDKLSDEEA
jgi:predicted transcriptional regulator